MNVLIIGAGDGGLVTADILRQMGHHPIGLIDANKEMWGKTIEGLPVYGGDDVIEQQQFDAIVLSMTQKMNIRMKLYDRLKEKYSFINVIHPTAYIAPNAKVGMGNFFGAFVFVGHDTIIGDNNHFSSHTSIEHHNRIGSHNLFAPGVITSGSVRIGSNCIFGAGVVMSNILTIGDRVTAATGTAITMDIQEDTCIKYSNGYPWKKIRGKKQ